MKLYDLIEFREDLFFEGAVQADWFYKKEKADKVTESFVFHGPKYFKNIDNLNSKFLIDTASLTKKIYSNLYSKDKTNPFMLGIAGYGSGKSHLSIALAKLFSNNPLDKVVNEKLLYNLGLADENIRKEIDLKDKRNLVIVLNGMKDFNLNYEILKALKNSLLLNKVSLDFLENLSQAYSIAKKFIEYNFEKNIEEYINEFKDEEKSKNELKNYILENIDIDSSIYTKINKIYKNNTGHDIKWDEGVSAGKILEIAEEYLCYKEGIFDKIIVIFDEFGRYLEYASSFPQQAGDSALQQIFEAVQNKEGNILFLGFIQSDIKTYLSRVDKASNISRYIGRYDVSEKFHLSSNLETIFANLISKKDKNTFKHYIENNIIYNDTKYKKLHTNLTNWIPQIEHKDIWKNYNNFRKIIVEGIYPLHPISTYMLSSMSDWLQNRSSITLLSTQIKKKENLEINEVDDLETIYPVELLEGDLFEEIYNAETEGRQRTSYSIQYLNIKNKIKEKVSIDEITILNSLLISKILKMNSKSKEETIKIIKELSGLNIIKISNSLELLENEYGVIQYDEAANIYDFIIDSVGLGEFKNFLKKEIGGTEFDFKTLDIPIIYDKFNISIPLKTSFSEIKNITSNEWNFEQFLFIANYVDEINFKKVKENLINLNSNSCRCGLIWIYIDKETELKKIEEIQKNYLNILEDYPIEVFLINDADNTLKNQLKTYQVLNEVTKNQSLFKRYEKFIDPLIDKTLDDIEDKFKLLKLKKERLLNNKIEIIEDKFNIFLNKILMNKYSNIIPFPFDGFSNKQLSNVKKSFVEISKLLLSSKNYNDIEVRSPEVKNRFKSVLMSSWGVIEKNYTIKYPENEILKNYYSYFDSLIEKKVFNIKELYEKLIKAPYGLNDYSFTLVLICYFANRFDEIAMTVDGKRNSLEKWREEAFSDKDIRLNKILNSKIEIIDIKDNEKRFSIICQDIINNSDLSNVDTLHKKLEDYINLFKVSDDKKYQYALADDKINKGNKLKNKYIEDLREIASEIDLGNKEVKLDKILRVISLKIENFEPEELFGYVYPKKDISNQKERALKIISEKGEEWIKKIYCSEPGKLDAFQKKMSNYIKQLFKLGYVELSTKLKTRADKFIYDLNLVKALNDVEKNVNIFFNETELLSQANYKELKQHQKNAKELKKLLKENDNILEMIESEYIKKIGIKEKELLKHIMTIENKLNMIYEISYELDSVEKAEKVLVLISTILGNGLDDSQGQELREISVFINKVLNNIREMKKVESLEDVNKIKNDILNYSEDEDLSINMSEVVKNEYLRIEKNILQKNNDWKNKFSNKKIEYLSAQEMRNMIREMENYPIYILDDTLTEVNKIQKELNDILSKNKLDFILGKYYELSNDEKEKFKLQVLV